MNHSICYNDFPSSDICVTNSGSYKTTFEGYPVLPVADVNVVNDKVVITTFYDGSREKAVCRDGDHFSKEFGVTICLMKKLLSNLSKDSSASGTNIYNTLLREALKKEGAFKAAKAEAKKKAKEAKAEKHKAREKERTKKKANEKWLESMVKKP